MEPLTTADRIRRSFRVNPDWDDRRRAKSLKVTLAEVAAIKATLNLPPPAGPAPKVRTLDQFRAEFDVREKIRHGLQAIGKGQYLNDPEFREACEVPVQYWRRFADLDEFKIYRWRFRDVVYWGQPATLAAMKEIVGVV